MKKNPDLYAFLRYWVSWSCLMGMTLRWKKSLAEMGKNGFLASISRSRILKSLENINIKIKIVEIGKKQSKSISTFLKKIGGIQYQYQNFWNICNRVNINIMIFEMCKKFQNQNQFYWKGVRKFNIKIKILENSTMESISKSRKIFLKKYQNSISKSRILRSQPIKIKIQNQNQ